MIIITNRDGLILVLHRVAKLLVIEIEQDGKVVGTRSLAHEQRQLEVGVIIFGKHDDSGGLGDANHLREVMSGLADLDCIKPFIPARFCNH